MKNYLFVFITGCVLLFGACKKTELGNINETSSAVNKTSNPKINIKAFALNHDQFLIAKALLRKKASRQEIDSVLSTFKLDQTRKQEQKSRLKVTDVNDEELLNLDVYPSGDIFMDNLSAGTMIGDGSYEYLTSMFIDFPPNLRTDVYPTLTLPIYLRVTNDPIGPNYNTYNHHLYFSCTQDSIDNNAALTPLLRNFAADDFSDEAPSFDISPYNDGGVSAVKFWAVAKEKRTKVTLHKIDDSFYYFLSGYEADYSYWIEDYIPPYTFVKAENVDNIYQIGNGQLYDDFTPSYGEIALGLVNANYNGILGSTGQAPEVYYFVDLTCRSEGAQKDNYKL